MGKLTDLQIRDWVKRGERFSGRGDGDGLGLRFRATDAAPRWIFRYRFGGEERFLDMGSYATLSLADARRTAKEMRARVALGFDVAGEKKERKRDALAKIEAARGVVKMGALADEYFAQQIMGRWKHPNIVRARIENDIKPNIGNLPIADVKPQHIDAMLKAIVKRGAPTMANDVLRWVKRMFDYAIKRDIAKFNPAAAFDQSDAGGKEESRDRWLTQAELVSLYAAMRTAKGWTYENGLVVKLLLMLAVRKGELIAARTEEFDLDVATWYLPGERTKTGAAIDIPLPTQAVAALRELIRLGQGSAWLLPARKMQERMVPHIDLNTVGAALAKSIKPHMSQSENFTIHDLRRTARTHLSKLKVPKEIAEKCLNHKVAGVLGTYDRHDYFDERKDALQHLADFLEKCERGGAEVIELRPAKTG